MGSSSEPYEGFRSRIEQIVAPAGDVEYADEAYLELAEEIIEATNKLEKRLLDVTTTVLIPSIYEHPLGILIHIGQITSPQELTQLKYVFYK